MKKSVVFILVAVLLMTACAPAFAGHSEPYHDGNGSSVKYTYGPWYFTGNTRGGDIRPGLPVMDLTPTPIEYQHQRTVTVTYRNNPSRNYTYKETKWFSSISL